MSKLQSCTEYANGAQFYRADLHIHSFGGSHDVADVTMTPSAIVDTSLLEGLDVIAVADHNEITNVQATVSAADGKPLFVVPAVELSTPQGHLLCYLPTVDGLQRFYGRLSIVDRGLPNCRCQQSLLECLNLVDEFAGFAVLAHVDAPGGFEVETPGQSPHKLDVLCHKALLGIELKAASSEISYAEDDPAPGRAAMGAQRIAKLSLGPKQYLARVLNSDSHTLNALGRNAQGLRKVSRIKMQTPTFDGLRLALEDSDARIRIEDLVPPTIPFVLGASLAGGFLDGTQVHFSPNLNCIIGGRGTGKSTLFEAVRCLSGQPSTSKHIDSDVWPVELELYWQDEAGIRHTLVRPLGSGISNLDDPATGPTAFFIESYGQGETAQISKEAQSDPGALLTYIDRFVDIREPLKEENDARDALLDLQTQIESATKNIALIPQYEKSLAFAKQQLAAIEKAKAKDVIDLQRQIAGERELRNQITQQIHAIAKGVTSFSPRTMVDGIAQLADDVSFAVGRKEFDDIVASARAFESEVSASQKTAERSYQRFEAEAEVKLKAWKDKEADSLRAVELKRKELETQGVRLDMAYIQKVAKDEAAYKTSLNTLRAWKPRLAQLQKLRREAAAKRWAARERIATIRDAYARGATERLKLALNDLMVSIKFSRNGYSPDASDQIVQAMGWRTIQVPRAATLIEKLTLPGLLTAIDKRDVKALTALTSDEGQKMFTKADAEGLIVKLGEPPIRFALERCQLQDLPRLSVTKQVIDADNSVRYVTRDFAKLSLGQQQSILLALMLSSTNTGPLIIDQPEDNLDGEFIYQTIVPVLRMAKERRQVIVVTHNANITVLGDAELILALRSTSDKGSIVSRGSIDDAAVRDTACQILEGARDAFQRRAKIYGIRPR